jgi:hypothetical protein
MRLPRKYEWDSTIPSSIRIHADALVYSVIDAEAERINRPRVTDGLRAACLWVAYRRCGYPRSIVEVSELTGCTRRSISLGVRRLEREAPHHATKTVSASCMSTMVNRFVDQMSPNVIDRSNAESIKTSARKLVSGIDVDEAHFSEHSIVTGSIVKSVMDSTNQSLNAVCRMMGISHTTTSIVVRLLFEKDYSRVK